MSTTQFVYGNAIIEIHRPTLTPEDRRKRETQIQIALQQFGKAAFEAGVDLSGNAD